MRPERGLAWFHLIFFVSGCAGLVYEVVWTRLLADVVGSTAVSLAGVLSVFLAGLALGAYLFGRLAVRGRRALRAYALVEVAVAATAAVASAVMLAGGTRLAALVPAGGLAADVSGSVGLAALLILAPTLLMGGSLPLLLQGVVAPTAPRGVPVRLYAWNTLGGAVGALAAGFGLIWLLGFRGTVAVAVTMNLAAAAGAWLLQGRVAEHEKGATPAPTAPPPPAPTPLWLAVAAGSGFALLAYEVLWSRLARFLLGDRTLAVSAVLATFIAALGAASLVAPVVARRWRAQEPGRDVALLGWVLVTGALLHALALPVATGTAAGGALAPFFAAWPLFAGRLVPAVVLMGVPVLVLGLAFPLLVWGARGLVEGPGRTVGLLYLVNTLGAVVGALAGTFLLADWVGTVGGMLWVSGAVALGGALLVVRGAPRRGTALGLACAGAVGVAVPMAAPPGLPLAREGETVLERNEDAYGAQVLSATPEGYLRVRNNRVSLVYDLGHPQTDHAQQMAAHLAVLLAGAPPERVLNLGTGYGITAGTFTLYPAVRSVRTVEILPFLASLQTRFAAHNFGYTDDPRVTLVTGDGRHDLLTAAEPFDVISVNVLDPYLPGSSSLYTVDFWRQARSRLRPGGVYTQLFWGADVDVLLRGILTVFPRVLLFPAYGGTSYNVVAFRDAGATSPAFALDRLGSAARRALEGVEGGEAESVLPRLLAEATALTRGLSEEALRYGGPLHTDDRPILEYRWAHGVAGVSPMDSPLVVY